MISSDLNLHSPALSLQEDGLVITERASVSERTDQEGRNRFEPFALGSYFLPLLRPHLNEHRTEQWAQGARLLTMDFTPEAPSSSVNLNWGAKLKNLPSNPAEFHRLEDGRSAFTAGVEAALTDVAGSRGPRPVALFSPEGFQSHAWLGLILFPRVETLSYSSEARDSFTTLWAIHLKVLH